MDLMDLSKKEAALRRLLKQSKQWQQLDKDVGMLIPANLRQYVSAACIENGYLVLFAANSMTASRLKMILPSLMPQLTGLHPDIDSVKVKVMPQTNDIKRENSLRLSNVALENLEDAADHVREKHPKLAAALDRLTKKHR